MPVESLQLVDFQAQKAELEAVLQSKSFTRAPRLAHLLSYLCERLFAGDACRIKEYSIGVEVFLRGSSFDQDARFDCAGGGQSACASAWLSITQAKALRIGCRSSFLWVSMFRNSNVWNRGRRQFVAGMATTPAGIKAAIEEAPRRSWERWIRLRDRRAWWVGAALMVVGLTFAGLRYRHFSRQLEQRAPAAVSNQIEGPVRGFPGWPSDGRGGQGFWPGQAAVTWTMRADCGARTRGFPAETR